MDAKSNEMQDLTELTTRVTSLELQFVQFRDEVRGEFSTTRAELRDEMRAGDEETRRLMRVLYEDLVERIQRLDRG